MTTISVTAGHLSLGIPGDCAACPVALAVGNAFPGVGGVSVGDHYISMYIGSRSELLPIPENVRALIADIDAGRPVEPFTFELDYPAVTPPARCTCTGPVAATFEETLTCPRRWWPVPGGGWAHAPGWAR